MMLLTPTYCKTTKLNIVFTLSCYFCLPHIQTKKSTFNNCQTNRRAFSCTNVKTDIKSDRNLNISVAMSKCVVSYCGKNLCIK